MTRVPTKKQYARLRLLGSGSALVVRPTERVWKSCAARGWIAPDDEAREGLWRLTPDGLRALADAVERYGWPPIRVKGHAPDLKAAK